MAARTLPNSGAPLLRALQQVLAEARRLQRLQVRVELLVDSLVQYLSKLASTAVPPPPGKLPGAPSASSPDPAALGDLSLLLAAQRGVAQLELVPLAGGAASVRIDGGKEFYLPRKLAALLRILAADTGRDGGELVGWKTPDEICARMEAALGEPNTRHALREQMRRLRREFKEQPGQNHYLLQTVARLGARFALRKPPHVTD